VARSLPVAVLLFCGCVLPPPRFDPADEPVDSATSIERDPPPDPGEEACSLTVATICADCDVTIDWSAATTTGDPFDPSDPDFVALWVYEDTIAPPDLADALCSGAQYVRPDTLSYRDGVRAVSVVLGIDLPRVTRVGIFEVGFGFEYFKAILRPDPGSINDFVELK
jgi:hypothetical protein